MAYVSVISWSMTLLITTNPSQSSCAAHIAYGVLDCIFCKNVRHEGSHRDYRRPGDGRFCKWSWKAWRLRMQLSLPQCTAYPFAIFLRTYCVPAYGSHGTETGYLTECYSS